MIPNATPDVAFSMSIDDLYDEARHWCDGEPLASQDQADALGKLLTTLRTTHRLADEARAEEKRPHDDASKAVQAKWKPILDKADRAMTAMQRPLTAFLAAQEAERIRQAEIARAEAERLAQEAAAMSRATLDDAEAHDHAIKAAAQAKRAADKISRTTARAAGEGRAVSLRTYHDTELSDPAAALGWLRTNRPDELRAAVLELIERVPLASRRAIPGVAIIERKQVA